ncbi:hypothetical protein CROQUDRAFT_673235 [Cronartium quercuum f. sp. fusiforme G11]|uniref:Tyrosine specific protein phosphatases domain-containing protein n=1 Tax=Cronartium quercuum f. sp. fusiforme G11 TaxID=708437 RepID=A0A9P6T8W2_9BASI|nr:hypothetical protein CROQUDRAFT_673235 [Cronartium quercuum f. sp. fusiforme G11]
MNSTQPTQIITSSFIKATPSPSPLVTPEMGERLCRMSSQHYMSDYNRSKRGLLPVNQQPQLHPTLPSSNQILLPPTAPLPQIPLQYQDPLSFNQPHPVLVNNQILNTKNTFETEVSQHHPIEKQRFRTRTPSPILQSTNLEKSIDNQHQHSLIQPTSFHQHSIVEPLTNHQQPIVEPTTYHQQSIVEPLPNQQQSIVHETASYAQKPIVESTNNHQRTITESMTVNNQRCESTIIKTSESHPMNVSPVIPPELLSTLSNFYIKEKEEIKIPIDLYDLTGINSNTAISTLNSTSIIINNNIRKLGNLHLSSCPGKKVRMNSNHTLPETNGTRSPICRDLHTDLKRVRESGIRAIICCLDDTELKFLGSPWNEYLKISNECDLEVYRIPMVEGFAPGNGIEEIDNLLQTVLRKWTFNGHHVLCHCRGGVGRAGLVACCWLIKIGLINLPIHSNVIYSTFIHNGVLHQQESQSQDVLLQVEKVIEVIRRRRSVKAIETPQQVHFILEYATWLANHKIKQISSSSS